MTDILPPLSDLILPLPHGGAQGSEPLAGSRHLCWDEAVLTPRDGAARRVAAGELPPRARALLSAPRPALCGLTFERPRIMGILNVTPDSFSDGGRHDALEAALARAAAMAQEADILDIGGESTRPGAKEVPAEEEIARTAPVIRAIRAAGITTPISIDTRKAAVAGAALDAGADIVNDVTALRFDPGMARLIAERGVPVCLMHSIATPETMQKHAVYDDVVLAVRDHLAERIEAAAAAGIAPEKLILDPGIGFGKTAEHDLALLRNLAAFQAFGLPVLLGASRKKFIGALTGAAVPAERVAGSLAVALHGAGQGAQILRVHDTKETRQALAMWQAMTGSAEKADHDT